MAAAAAGGGRRPAANQAGHGRPYSLSTQRPINARPRVGEHPRRLLLHVELVLVRVRVRVRARVRVRVS